MSSYSTAAGLAVAFLLTDAALAPVRAEDTAKDDIISALTKELATYQARDKANTRNLAAFDVLDFEVYSSKQWDRFGETHTDDILVHYPDGHTTDTLEAHVNEMKWFTSWSPDARVEEHPVRFGDGEYTGVTGVSTGTFSAPMTLPDGTVIPPTGKSFTVEMVTIGHWNAEGKMDEEWLFWDNQAILKQLGLAP